MSEIRDVTKTIFGNNFYEASAALSSATQHAIPPEFGRKWGTECLNTRFPLPTLLCAGYSVKLILQKKATKLKSTVQNTQHKLCLLLIS